MDPAHANSGCWVLRPAPLRAETTIVVTGVGRSGTTMIARILSELGVFMGASLAHRTNEDNDVKQCVKDGDEAGFERLCRLRDEQHKTWGFKNPAFRDRIPDWEKHLRNPRVIFLFRDVLAIALRNHIVLNIDVQEALALATRSYVKALKRLEESGCPALLLSYEKCLAAPDLAVARIAEFCGVSPNAEILAAASSVIQNGDERYFAADA
jgi:hypothetical protein